jgi:uncharacterized Zn finger protein
MLNMKCPNCNSKSLKQKWDTLLECKDCGQHFYGHLSYDVDDDEVPVYEGSEDGPDNDEPEVIEETASVVAPTLKPKPVTKPKPKPKPKTAARSSK